MKKGAKEALEEFLKVKEEYLNEPVIVEGIKDKAALKQLGFKKIIMTDKALYKVVEGITEKKVVILTDLDKTGKKIYYHLKKGLTDRGVVVDNKLRDLLFKTELRQVEGLTKYIETMESHTETPVEKQDL